MTRLLFLPNDQTFLLLESPLPADKAVKAVKSGQWTAPEPYGSLLAELEPHISLRASRQGSLIIVTTSRPLDLHDRSLQSHSKHSGYFLTGRQADVLQYLAEGLSTKEIAVRMGLTPRTVHMHIAALKQRLGASTRAQSVMTAASLGLCRTVIHQNETHADCKPR